MPDTIHGEYAINAGIIKYVLEHSTAQGLERLMLIAVASALQERMASGDYKMSVNTIARWTGLTIEEASAYIQISRLFNKFGWTNGYDITVDYQKFIAALE